jgi:hypothetical protein
MIREKKENIIRIILSIKKYLCTQGLLFFIF